MYIALRMKCGVVLSGKAQVVCFKCVAERCEMRMLSSVKSLLSTYNVDERCIRMRLDFAEQAKY